MKTIKIMLLAVLTVFAVGAQADSVYHWGHWNTSPEQALRQAILQGQDPTAVTQPTAAGPAAGSSATALQPVHPQTLDNQFITQEGLPKVGQVTTSVQTTPVDPLDGPPSGGLTPPDALNGPASGGLVSPIPR